MYEDYDLDQSDEVSEDLYCPITNKIMKEPFTIEDDGQTYEKEAILKYLEENAGLSPITRKKISKKGFLNNKIIQKIKEFWDKIQNKEINVTVSTTTGKTLNIKINTNDTIKKLKEKIKEKENIDEDNQMLKYNGKDISCDMSTLKNLDIKDGAVIYLVTRYRGGNKTIHIVNRK